MSCALVSGVFFFFKQKTAYEMRISDWSSDVCFSDLLESCPRHQSPTDDVDSSPTPRGMICGMGWRRATMEKIATIGLDIAKSVFQVHGVDAAGEVVVRKRLSRARVIPFFAKLPRCLVGDRKSVV